MGEEFGVCDFGWEGSLGWRGRGLFGDGEVGGGGCGFWRRFER